jgi:hypothetical protein
MLNWKTLKLEKGRKLETERLQGKGALWAWFYIGSILMEKGSKFKGTAQFRKVQRFIGHFPFIISHFPFDKSLIGNRRIGRMGHIGPINSEMENEKWKMTNDK